MTLTIPTVPRMTPMSRPPTASQVEAREHIIWLHREAGISIAELARRMNVHWTGVSRWVNERYYPSPMAVDRIERVYLDEVSRRQAE